MTHRERPLKAMIALALLLTMLAAIVVPRSSAAGTHTQRHAASRLSLTVRGRRLVWSGARGARSYVLSIEYPARRVHRVVRHTSVKLPPARAATVRFTVRAAMRGSAWAPAITVVYGWRGNIERVEGAGTSIGRRHSGPPAPQPPPVTEETVPPPVESAAQSLKVGLIGGVVGWGAQAAETIRQQTGVRFTRVAIGPEGWAQPSELVHEGITPLILYNPGLHGMPPAAVAQGIAEYVPHMKELGLTEVELGNEVYYHSSTPAEYAAQYAAAHKVLAGTGIKLLADVWTDAYDEATGKWSQWESSGGWGVMFVHALGYVPDAWSFHAYGPMTADGFGSGQYQPGWATVPRMISYMKQDNIYAPFNITEVGQPVWQGDDGNAAVTEAEQAADIRQYIRQASEWGLQSIYLYEGIDTPEGGYGLYKWPLQARPSAAVFAESVAQYSEKPALPAHSASLAESEGL